jgi:hypothetical protein
VRARQRRFCFISVGNGTQVMRTGTNPPIPIGTASIPSAHEGAGDPAA